MADELPPPPSYHSLFQGDSQAGPSAPHPTSTPPVLPPDAPPDVGTRTPPIGALGKSSSKSYSRQASLDSPYPPSHPYYPGPINLPSLSPDEAPGAGATGACNFSGAASYDPTAGAEPQKQYPPVPHGEASAYGPIHMGGVLPTSGPPIGQPVPPPYPPSGAPYPPPVDAAYPPPSAPTQVPAQPSDPLINPPYNPNAPYNYPSNYNTNQPAPSEGISNQQPGWQEIPIVEGSVSDYSPDADDVIAVNEIAPHQCQLSTLEQYPDLRLAEGQREHIDQLDPNEEPAYCKWCLVAFFSFGSHIGFIVCVWVLIVQVPLKQYSDNDDWPAGVYREDYNYSALIAASVFLCICWIVATIESYVSDTRTYIKNTMRLSDFRKEHTKVRTMVPTVVWVGESYHYAKERVVWKDGRIVGRRRSSDTHKCVTKRERIAFQFSQCVDASGDLDTFQKGVINRFEFEKTFGFLDEATAEEYQFRKKTFIAKFEGSDESFSFEEALVVPEMKERATVYMTEGCRTSLMSPGFYTLLTLLLLTWPYRIFFRCATRKKKFTFVKLIGI